MRKIIRFCLCALFAAGAMCGAVAQDLSSIEFKISYGPYLQQLTDNSVVISFATNFMSMSYVELREKGAAETKRFETLKDGLRQAHLMHNNIEVEGLKADTEYEYRVVTKKTELYKPYDIRFGREVYSKWYDFKTFDPESEEFTFVATSDIHDDAGKCDNLLSQQPMDEAEAVFYVGDIVCDISRKNQAYESIIKPSTYHFAHNKPMILARGNHEVRGMFCRDLDEYFVKKDDRYYSLQLFGKTAVLVLDSCEDKPDNSKVFNGVKELESYMDEQIEWLAQTVKSKEWRKAKHRIVMLHIPPASKPMQDDELMKKHICWGGARWGSMAMDIFNKAKIDLMISGHTHRFFFVPEKKGEQNYPLVVNDNRSAMSVKVEKEGIAVKVTNIDGKVLLDEYFED